MVTLISPCKNGANLIRYLLNGEGHDGSAERNIYVDTVGLLPNKDAAGYISQYRQEWSRASARHKVQCRHIIISPSDKEIPYLKSNAVKFSTIVKEYIREHYPDRRALICIQQDGTGFKDEKGKMKKIMHAHVALSDCDLYSYRGVEKEKTSFRFLSSTFDDFVTEKYKIKLDKGRDLPQRRYLSKKLITENERDDEGKFFAYTDDIKDRIQKCINASEDLDSFYDNLSLYGLSVEQRTKKNGESYQTYYLHDLTNISDASKDSNGNIKALAKKDQCPAMRSYRQKGYSVEEIEYRIKHKQQSDKDIQIPETYTSTYKDTGAEERHKFYVFCRENRIEYGQGEQFDSEKFKEAKKKYEEHISGVADEKKNTDKEQAPVIETPEKNTNVHRVRYQRKSSKKSNDDMQKEITYTRYQLARQELGMDYVEKQTQRSL